MPEENEIVIKTFEPSSFFTEDAEGDRAKFNAAMEQLEAKLQESKPAGEVTNVQSSGTGGGAKPKTEDRDSKLNELEQSLINFLSHKKDAENLIAGGARRLRSLKFNIVVKNAKPFFSIQIGVCEACFNPETGTKEKGSCFGIERFVRTWFESGSVAMDIQQYITKKSKEAKKSK